MNERICKTCYWWRADRACTYNPPVVNMMGDLNARKENAHWPKTLDYDGCSKWRPESD